MKKIGPKYMLADLSSLVKGKTHEFKEQWARKLSGKLRPGGSRDWAVWAVVLGSPRSRTGFFMSPASHRKKSSNNGGLQPHGKKLHFFRHVSLLGATQTGANLQSELGKK
jgi:hypothetical protein